MRTSLSAMIVAFSACVTLSAEPAVYHVYVGTYTSKGGSQGIYHLELDAKTGKLSAPGVAAEANSPSFLTLSPNGKYLYAVGETGGKDGGAVLAYGVDSASGKLTALNQVTSGGSGPCHIATDAAGKFAIVANYGGGSTALCAIKADGSFDARTGFVQHKGSSVNASRQKEPHAHCGSFDSTGKFALVADLGLDQIIVYAVDRDAGKLTETHTIKLPAGSGPRHLHMAPSNELLFVCGELDSTVNVAKVDLAHGKSEVVQSLSTLPGGKPVPGNSTAECRIHPNGKFVYVSNRGHNSIAAFGWDGSKLTALGHATEGIKVPRNFNITPDGHWMLVASQDGDTISVFSIGEDGIPKPTGNSVKVSKPVCVKFLAKS